MSPPLRIAHRGIPSLALENTLRSFELALDYGAQGIELDVHASSDGVIVVHHDPALINGTELRRSTLADLRETFPELPTLQGVCELVAGRAELFVEIKGDGIENAVAKALRGYAGDAAIHSFDHALIQRLAASGIRRRLGILVESPTPDAVTEMIGAGALDLWPDHPLVSLEMVNAVHALGGRVIPWTVNAPDDIARMEGLHVDGICSDDVRALG